MKLHLVGLLILASIGCKAAPAPDPLAERTAVDAVLDDWHLAASVADGERYFGHMAADSVFLGTDAGERWTLDEFRAYSAPYFSAGRGWTYSPRERHVVVAGGVAWFDERLWNEKYGEVRGTGVLRHDGAGWTIVHYSMSFPVPNELAGEFIQLLRGSG